MKTINKMNLQLFAYEDYGTSDFFTQTFNEMYTPVENDNNTSTEGATEVIDAPVSDSIETPEEIPNEVIETPSTPPEEVIPTVTPQLTKEELIEAMRASQEPVVNEETQQALELMAYLKENPHLISAMREVNPGAHQQLNNYVPDEQTKKMQQFEEFMIEQQYQKVIDVMKTKYADFDEEKVVGFAEQHEISDLDIAYKALKAEVTPSFDVVAERNKLREELKAELLAELKQDASSTSSIVGTGGSVPPVQTEVIISKQEKKVAKAMNMTTEDYAKWRDGK